MSDASSRVVFVYGTLRRGDVRDINRLKPKPKCLGNAWVRGKMYDLGSYPGLRLEQLPLQKSSDLPLSQTLDCSQHSTASLDIGWVKGELYAVLPALELQLDEIEEVWPQQSGEYAKRDVVAWRDAASGVDADPSDPDSGVACFLYEVARERVRGMEQIASGDWVFHMRRRFRDPR